MSKKSDDILISELFTEYRQMMFKIALGILHNKSDAEDVIQNAFMWIINNLDKITQIPCNKRASGFINKGKSVYLAGKNVYDDMEQLGVFESDMTEAILDVEDMK